MITLTPPTIEPVTLAEAKTAARIDGTVWDSIVTASIKAAREYAEHLTGRHFMQQVQRFELDAFPDADEVLSVYRPTAVAVSYWNGSTFAALATPAAFAWDSVDHGFSVAPALGTSWPTLADKAIGHRVRIDATVGATDAAAVPECAKTFVKAMVTVMVHDPSLTVQLVGETQPHLLRILDPINTYAKA